MADGQARNQSKTGTVKKGQIQIVVNGNHLVTKTDTGRA